MGRKNSSHASDVEDEESEVAFDLSRWKWKLKCRTP